MFDLWEVAEYVGETIVFIGVTGEVFADWKEPKRVRLAKASSLVLVLGLALSLVALIGTNEHFNGTIADLNAQAGKSNQNAADAERDAADARRDTAQLAKDAQKLKTAEVSAELELARLTGPPYSVPVIRGVAVPDILKGNKQRVLLTSETLIKLPVLPKGKSFSWTLTITQDAVGQHQFRFSPAISGFAPGLYSPSHSSWVVNLETDHSGTINKGLGGTFVAAPANMPTKN
jgi:hypothetical protein